MFANLGPELHNSVTQFLALLLSFFSLVCLLAFLSQPCTDSLVIQSFPMLEIKPTATQQVFYPEVHPSLNRLNLRN